MPNYQPTPRRFSVLSVSRTASRRNSIDDSARPGLAPDTPGFPPETPSVNLADALKHLQHVDVEGEKERGRSRHSAGHNGPIAVWGHDGTVRAPSARRENSASTRERIAVWEERSRSQSKGRSKSRGRDLAHLGAGSRISIVPEVPELAAVFSKFSKDQEPPDSMSGQSKISSADAAENRVEENASSTTPRPQTPIRVPEPLVLTPEATPKQPMNHESSPVHVSLGGFRSPTGPPPTVLPSFSKPSTPIQHSSSALPPTPEATPERQAEHSEDLGSPGYRQVFQPINLERGDTSWELGVQLQTVAEPTYQHSEPAVHGKDISANQQPHNQNQMVAVDKDRDLDTTKDGPDITRYHQIWRISSYQPDIPLASRSSQTASIQSPGNPRFEGNPLQRLPQTQQSKGIATYRPRVTTDAYPYSTDQTSGKSRDWIVNMPATAVPIKEPIMSPAQQSLRSNQSSQTRRVSQSDRYTRSPRSKPKNHEWDAPPVIERAIHAASVSMIQGLQVPVELYRGFKEVYYPPPNRPNIIKAYPIRKRLPVRIFFPTQHDLTSPLLLPTVFTIHGGAFTLGTPSDDDVWNRSFSDSHSILVVALNYSKASPLGVASSFPAPLKDVEAIYHSVLNDDSLPIDRMRTAILGFDAGANLALGLSQLPSVKTGKDPNAYPDHPYFDQRVRSNPPPAAAISVCGVLDFTVSVGDKLKTRRYKRNLKGPRGWGPGLDWVAKILPSSAWSYIPYRQDAADPLLSPVYSAREDMPPHVFVIGAELDCLAHESWKAACAWSGGKRAVPGRDEVVGRKEVAVWRGCLDDGKGKDAARFGWMEGFEGAEAKGSTRWLLVPDAVHGFDSAAWRNRYLWGDEEARMDAEMKTVAYQREIGEWLWGVVWR